jgi:hypothetical protein
VGFFCNPPPQGQQQPQKTLQHPQHKRRCLQQRTALPLLLFSAPAATRAGWQSGTPPGEKTSGGVGPGDSPGGWILGTQQTPGENIPGVSTTRHHHRVRKFRVDLVGGPGEGLLT